MRRSTSALTAAVLGTALSATTLMAQQTPPDSGSGTSTASIPGMTTSRGARYLLRNGWDYLKYQEYERALNFFREAEQRKAELNPSERQALTQGIDNARRGMREAGDGSASPSYAGRGPIRRPGAFALAKSTASASGTPEPEPIQLTSGTRPVVKPASAVSEASLPSLPQGTATSGALPTSPPLDSAMTLAQGAPAPLADPGPAAAAPAVPPSPGTAPVTDLPPLDLNAVPLPPLSNDAAETPPASTPTPAPEVPSMPAPLASEPPAPLAEPTAAAPVPVSTPVPVPAPVAEPTPPAELPGTAPALPESLPEPPAPRVAALPDASEPPSSLPVPAASEEPPPPLPAESMGRGADQVQPRSVPSDSFLPERSANVPSTLSPELQREVERIAQKQEDELRAQPSPDRIIPGSTPNIGDARGLGTSPGLPSPRLEISRAPSPTEARPIRAIPVPDEFVPLAKRDWGPQRKYWSSAAVCHMPLYFQDAALERYGQTVEQAVGPAGRFLSYPVDDPKQSIQRNQIFQPIASMGIFAAQIALLPYNLIMDPPWEAEYDLGYYRPGDRIPPDTYYLPLTGVGPPLHGKRY
ncbi:hypothetical protein [Singulisphaera acidiphila]|uniref:Tetratricopeptide repeat protein n=2 Tax=Singulisphaera acidiphila TaxID=466153 RepID=L0DRG8_SINAD|nr:hypothetical protein [Singulisphaera acidiphila]AGA31572.1 hypothetical protein Sinac_7539 [Singulisphaera acidiphila DSM 18658]